MAQKRTAFYNPQKVDVEIHRIILQDDGKAPLYQCRPFCTSTFEHRDWIYARQNELMFYVKGSDGQSFQNERLQRRRLSAAPPRYSDDSV